MDAVERSGNWGDPYIGLQLAADAVAGYRKIVIETPRLARVGMYAALGGPGVFEDIAEFLRNVLNYLNPSVIMSWLWSSVVVPGRNWLKDDLWSSIASFLNNQVTLAMSWLGNIVNPVKDAVRGALDAGRIVLEAIRAWLSGTFAGWFCSLKDAVVAARLWLTQTFGPALDAIRGSVEALRSWLSQTCGPWVAAIRDAVTGVRVWLSQTFASTVEGIRERVANVYDWLRTTATSIWTGVKQGVVDSYVWLRDVAGPALASLPTVIWQGLLRWLGDAISCVSAWLWGIGAEVARRIDDLIADTRPALERLWAGLQTVPATLLEWAHVVGGENLALEPGRALALAGGLYAIAFAAGSGAHLTATALNALPTFNWVGASQLSAFLAQAAAFEPLTRATYGVLINEVLSWPLRYYWHSEFRPRIPSEGEIFVMGRKRGLNRQEFGQAMAYQGLPDWWIDKMYRFFWTDPSPMWLLRMSEVSNPAIEPSAQFLPWLDEWMPDWRQDPWAWYRMKLMLAGFEDTDIPAFIDAFKRRLVTSPVTQLKTSVRAMVREGYWGRTEVENVLRPLGARQDEIEYLMLAEDLDYQHKYLTDQVTSLQEAFRKGAISRQDLSLGLSTIIVRPERVAQIVAREEIRALPTPKAVAPAKEDPLIKTLTTQAVSSWTKAYRDWQITAADLELGLAVVLRDPARAAELRRIEETRYRPAPVVAPGPPEDPTVAASRRASIASWIQQYRDGTISADVLELGLTPLINNPELVKQIRKLEELRAPISPDIVPVYEEDPSLAAARQEYVRAHLEMFSKRLITLQELYGYLLVDGLAEALARATALTQAMKRVKAPPVDSPYFLRDRMRSALDDAIDAYTMMVQRAEITIDEYRINLVAAGVDPDLAAYLADTEEVRQFLRVQP